MEMAVRSALVTVTDDEPLTPETVAVTVATPTPIAVTRPCVPALFETAATPSSDEVQLACVLRSCVVPSEYAPVATRGWLVPLAIDGLAGATDSETRVAAVTVTVVVPVTPESCAEAVIVPVAMALTSPRWPLAFDTVATAWSDEPQVAW